MNKLKIALITSALAVACQAQTFVAVPATAAICATATFPCTPGVTFVLAVTPAGTDPSTVAGAVPPSPTAATPAPLPSSTVVPSLPASLAPVVPPSAPSGPQSNFPTHYVAPPPTFVPASFFGTPIQIATLETYLQGWLAQVTTVSTPTLVNEGVTSPAGFTGAALNVAQSVCQEGNPPDCANQVALITKYAGMAQAAYANVPASQWNPATYSSHELAPTAPPVAPPTPPPSNVVGSCFIDSSTVSIKCYPAPGVSINRFYDGTVVNSNGKAYTAHVSTTLMGATLYFTPNN